MLQLGFMPMCRMSKERARGLRAKGRLCGELKAVMIALQAWT